jgi:coenzyme F420-0:L-glutamate ligase/coenzyme F420-1:gamma-L-glutamate ligase
VVVVTHKIVSKAEGCVLHLSAVQPSPQAVALAALTDKDPRHVEVILRQSRSIVRQHTGLLIAETQHGWICANAGVDRSNVAGPDGETVLTLPADPDASARAIRAGLMAATYTDIAVIISDTHGRAWRLGTVNVALGVAGMLPSPTCAANRTATATSCASPPSPAPTNWPPPPAWSAGKPPRASPSS